MKNFRSSVLVSLAAIGFAVGLSACPAPGDDDDDTGLANTNCQIVWANQGTTVGRYDIYLIDMPIAEWTDGTKDFNQDDGRVAIFYDELIVSSNAYFSRAISTAGTFSVTATQGTAIGEPVTLTDAGGHLYFDLQANEETGIQVGTGGLANFSSNWSVSPALDPDPAARVVIGYYNTAYNLGLYTNYATCYRRQGAGFAPEQPADRAVRALQETFPRP